MKKGYTRTRWYEDEWKALLASHSPKDAITRVQALGGGRTAAAICSAYNRAMKGEMPKLRAGSPQPQAISKDSDTVIAQTPNGDWVVTTERTFGSLKDLGAYLARLD